MHAFCLLPLFLPFVSGACVGLATTGIAFFAECLRHSAKISSAKGSLPNVFFRTLGKDFAECQKVLGKEKHSAN
jgi:hypothetical protein